MEKIQIILKEDVPNLGKSGELVAVRPGYGRNYLIPQGLALLATKKNVTELEHQRKQIEARSAKLKADAEATAGKVNGQHVTIERSVGEGDKLFGSVTTRDIEDALKAKGLVVDKKKIALHEPLKALGDFEVEIKVARDVSAKIKVSVVKKA
jgi:large subunit ribosomal protein L9